MKKLTTNEAMNINAGKTVTLKCKVCKQTVTANYWGQYWHCVKHAAKGVWSVAEFAAMCFGFAALI